MDDLQYWGSVDAADVGENDSEAYGTMCAQRAVFYIENWLQGTQEKIENACCFAKYLGDFLKGGWLGFENGYIGSAEIFGS